MTNVSYYIHNLEPVIFHITGPLAVRWYGLSYLAGFIAAYILLLHLSRKGLFPVPKEQVQNLVVLTGFIGVFIGGRLGYCLFYGLDDWLRDPLFPLKVWQGGMASHGGMIGVILTLYFYARKHGHRFLDLTDNFACVVPVGIFFGRLANFINGELWGRVTRVPWAVIFPQEAGLHSPKEWNMYYIQDLVAQGVLHPRHPSQLYEAFGEGLLLFGVLWALRFSRFSRRSGVLSAAFLIVYAIARILAEFVREPDSTVYFGWLTRGQALSFFMFIVAAVLILFVRHRSTTDPA